MAKVYIIVHQNYPSQVSRTLHRNISTLGHLTKSPTVKKPGLLTGCNGVPFCLHESVDKEQTNRSVSKVVAAHPLTTTQSTCRSCRKTAHSAANMDLVSNCMGHGHSKLKAEILRSCYLLEGVSGNAGRISGRQTLHIVHLCAFNSCSARHSAFSFQDDPSVKNSFFQIGTVAFNSSMIQWHASMAAFL